MQVKHTNQANTYTATVEEGIVLKFLLLLTSVAHFSLFLWPSVPLSLHCYSEGILDASGAFLTGD